MPQLRPSDVAATTIKVYFERGQLGLNCYSQGGPITQWRCVYFKMRLLRAPLGMNVKRY